MSQKEAPIRVFGLLNSLVLANTVVLTLIHGVCLTRVARTVSEGDTILAGFRPHLAIVDVDMGNDRLIQRLGLAGSDHRTRVPVLALSQKGDLKTRLAAFDQGVDDIMTIPFSSEELLARTMVLARRSLGVVHPLQPTLYLGEIEIDILKRHARVGMDEVDLSGTELSMLYLLAANAGRVMSRDEILDTIWGTDFISESNLVDRHVERLRAKLHDDWHHPRFIATVPGRGYRFIPTPSEV